MNLVFSNMLAGTRRRPLAAGLASIFALSSPLACVAATTWIVNSCDGDAVSGVGTAGTLRYAINNAASSGDTVSLTGLTGPNACANSKISITTGEIFVNKDSLTIAGPGASNLMIDGIGLYGGPSGLNNSRVFTHTGSGTLTIKDLTVTGGHVYHFAGGSLYYSRGGCIYSAGNVTLRSSVVASCSATQAGGYVAAGGGIYAKGSLSLYSSILNNNVVQGGVTAGGGALVLDGFYANYSTVSNNRADGGNAVGGGVKASGIAVVAASTISGNYSAVKAGGIAASGNVLSVLNSTISGNSAASEVGGVYSNSATIQFLNSTIAFNTASIYPGVQLMAIGHSVDVALQSTLMSDNTYPNGVEDDLATHANSGYTLTFNGGDAATPANNLIRVSFAPGLPNDTKLFGSCPLLGPLRDNGGLTMTHALLSHSEAIDAGNNTYGGFGLPFDQRGGTLINGTIDYPRVSGLHPDIGAYEVQQDDVIFNSGFEDCPSG